jgi:capsular polysaccharide export protein
MDSAEHISRLKVLLAVADTVRATPTNPAYLALCAASTILLLQGPLGPFYDRLARWLQGQGKRVLRVAFQGGDLADCRVVEPVVYRGTLEAWPAFLADLLAREDVDAVVLFGQARSYHAAAVEEARDRYCAVIVLEEGYFRPGFVTMELDGVNGYSRTLENYRWTHETPIPPAPLQADDTPHHFRKMVLHATRHYLAMWVRRHHFGTYQHHREPSPWYYLGYWLRTWSRKARRYRRDLHLENELIASGEPFFLVPLQNDGDSQITHHSVYGENSMFIMEVLRSFAVHSPPDSKLVFRVHPYARGGHAHRHLIRSVTEDLGIGARVIYLMEGHTPVLAQHSRGVVLINSTVGLQVLERGAPLMALGESVYRSQGLTFSGSLDRFWSEATSADREAVDSFLVQLKNLTQMPASVYANADEPLRWPAPLL